MSSRGVSDDAKRSRSVTQTTRKTLYNGVLMKLENLVFFAALLFVVACSGDENAANDSGAESDMGIETDAEETGPPTYHRDIRPLVEANCIGCHSAGDIGPFELQNYENVKRHSSLMLASIESGQMPPWPADTECRDYKDQRILSEADIQVVREWIDADMPEGDEADFVAPELAAVERGPADIIARPSGPFEPTVESGDEYRCFLLDKTFEEDTWVTGVDVVPGNRQLVHHANMFLINPTNASRVEALENQDSEPGYSCFGDPGVSTINLIGSWVPGLDPIQLPEDSAVRVRAGSRIIMQTHFNSVYTDIAPVESEFHLWTRDEPPAYVVRAMPFANLNFEVMAGDPESVHVEEFKNLSSESWRVLGSAAHLHLLASRVKVEVIKRRTEENQCVLDIPDWDFDWQMAYFFSDDQWMTVDPGDRVRLTCVYDNSLENQPVIDGQRLAPRDVSWGGGTFDEMCLNFLIVAEEFDEDSLATGELCDQFKSCRDQCDDPFGIGCLFNCGTTELDCGECLLGGAQRCANRFCDAELDDALPCIYNCAQGAQAGGDIDSCLLERCPAERNALNDCLRPRIEGGFCNENLSACNIEF